MSQAKTKTKARTKKTLEHTIPRRATFFTRALPKKKFKMWIPTKVENAFLENPDDPSIMALAYYLEANGIERIDTNIYKAPEEDPDFELFYLAHLERYNVNGVDFCSDENGGVNAEYVIDTANANRDHDTITLMSLDVDDGSDDIREVYALITIQLVDKSPETLMIETLCGNQALPGSGEGTRLFNYIQTRAKEVGLNKIALHPVDTAITYYNKLKFRRLKHLEAKQINSSGSSGTSKSGSKSGSKKEITMQKNLRAVSNWNKLRNATRVLGFYKNTQKARQIEEIQTRRVQEIKNQLAQKTQQTKKKGNPIAAPFTTKTAKFRPKVMPFKKSESAIPILPGETLKKSRLLSEIKDKELLTRLRSEALKNDK